MTKVKEKPLTREELERPFLRYFELVSAMPSNAEIAAEMRKTGRRPKRIPDSFLECPCRRDDC